MKIRSSASASLSGLRVSHSQTTATCQPNRINSAIFLSSRRRFSSSLVDQKPALLLGLRVPRSHSVQPCQKQPCTKTAVRCLGRTISGRPGRSRRCSRNLRPRACMAFRTAISGAVFCVRTAAIWRPLRLTAALRPAIDPRAKRSVMSGFMAQECETTKPNPRGVRPIQPEIRIVNADTRGVSVQSCVASTMLT